MNAMDNNGRVAVSLLGTGTMGSAITRALLGAGHPVTVWNRTPRRAEALVADGADVAATAADAAMASPVVVLCVVDQAAVMEVCKAIGDGIAGRVIVNLASGSPAQARAVGAWASEHGARYLDGSMLADPDRIGNADAVFLYSGDPTAYADHRTVLDALGHTTHYGSDPGLAASYFMGLVSFGYDTWLAFLRTIAHVHGDDVDPTAFAPLATDMLGASADLLAAMAQAMVDGNHRPLAGTLAIHAALIDHVITARHDAGVDTASLRDVKHLIDRRVEQGHGQDGFSSIGELVRRGPARTAAPHATP